MGKSSCDLLAFLCGLHIVFSVLISLSRADVRAAISLLGMVASIERKKRLLTSFLALSCVCILTDLVWIFVHGRFVQEIAFSELQDAPAFVANIVRSHIFSLVVSFFQAVLTIATLLCTFNILC